MERIFVSLPGNEIQGNENATIVNEFLILLSHEKISIEMQLFVMFLVAKISNMT